MISMINSTASFSGLGIQMAGKTGTAQQSEIHPDHGLFVGFAPADAPEIAIAVRIANGYSSSYAAEIGRDIVKAKYQLGDINEIITGLSLIHIYIRCNGRNENSRSADREICTVRIIK